MDQATFIIINRNNSLTTVLGCLKAIRERCRYGEIILVDDHSEYQLDKSIDQYADKIIKNQSRRGIGFSRMRGLDQASHSIVFMIDSDILLQQLRLHHISRRFIEHPRLVGICGWYESDGMQNWNRALDIRRRFFYGKFHGDFTLLSHPDEGTFSGGFCVLHKERVGLVRQQTHLTAGGEDIFFQALLSAQGFQFGFDSSFQGLHKHHRSFRAAMRKAVSDAHGAIRVSTLCTRAAVCPPRIECFTGFPLLLLVCVVVREWAIILVLLELLPLLFLLLIERTKGSLMLLICEIVSSFAKIYYGAKYLISYDLTLSERGHLLLFFCYSGFVSKAKWAGRLPIYLKSRGK